MTVIDDKRLNEMIAGMKLYADMPYGVKINEFSAKDLYSAMVELRELRAAKNKINLLEEEVVEIESTLTQAEGDRDNLRQELQSIKNQISTWEEAYKLSVDNGNKAWKTVTDLQAAYTVVRETLEGVREEVSTWYGDFPEKLHTMAEHALSTTPPEAGEMVRGLVEALEFYANTENYAHRVDEHAIGWIDPVVFDDTGKRAKDALAKYRGGAADEHGTRPPNPVP